jgi:hypothetical protein
MPEAKYIGPLMKANGEPYKTNARGATWEHRCAAYAFKGKKP